MVDSLDEEGDDEFIDILNENSNAENKTFCKDLKSAYSRNVDDNEGNEGIGEIVIGGLIVGAIGFVSILTFIQYIRYAICRHRAT